MMRSNLYKASTDPVDLADWTTALPAEVHAQTTDGLALTGYFWRGDREDRDVIIFFHGRGAHQGVGAKYAEYMTGHGDHVLVASYRGFGGNPGEPNQEALLRDGQAFVRLARQIVGRNAAIYLTGHSLGGAVALHVAAIEDVAGVISLSTFDKLEDAAPAYLRRLLPDAWDNLAAIRKVDEPVLVVHGGADEQVDAGQAVRLFDRANTPAALLLIEQAAHKPSMGKLAPIITEAVEAIDGAGLNTFPAHLPPGWSVRTK
ncbi:alpha/beta hydrolase [Sphingomonas sp. ID0503]|uniref:alpha/beta hydrolase n=1 Tax=Sphingomonas sp. ID0503 TaxID=3399691 RepID=UPI003AFA2502